MSNVKLSYVGGSQSPWREPTQTRRVQESGIEPRNFLLWGNSANHCTTVTPFAKSVLLRLHVITDVISHGTFWRSPWASLGDSSEEELPFTKQYPLLFVRTEPGSQGDRGEREREREKRKRKVGRGEDGVVPSWESNPQPTCWVVTVLTAAAAALEGKAALDFL